MIPLYVNRVFLSDQLGDDFTIVRHYSRVRKNGERTDGVNRGRRNRSLNRPRYQPRLLEAALSTGNTITVPWCIHAGKCGTIMICTEKLLIERRNCFLVIFRMRSKRRDTTSGRFLVSHKFTRLRVRTTTFVRSFVRVASHLMGPSSSPSLSADREKPI